jgi:hypothetical protein
MKSKDQILLEEAYTSIKENNSRSFRWIEVDPGVEVSNRTYNVRGQEVLLKREKDQDEDDVWYYFSFIDPTTKERVFKDIPEEELLAIVNKE